MTPLWQGWWNKTAFAFNMTLRMKNGWNVSFDAFHFCLLLCSYSRTLMKQQYWIGIFVRICLQNLWKCFKNYRLGSISRIFWRKWAGFSEETKAVHASLCALWGRASTLHTNEVKFHMPLPKNGNQGFLGGWLVPAKHSAQLQLSNWQKNNHLRSIILLNLRLLIFGSLGSGQEVEILTIFPVLPQTEPVDLH